MSPGKTYKRYISLLHDFCFSTHGRLAFTRQKSSRSARCSISTSREAQRRTRRQRGRYSVMKAVFVPGGSMVRSLWSMWSKVPRPRRFIRPIGSISPPVFFNLGSNPYCIPFSSSVRIDYVGFLSSSSSILAYPYIRKIRKICALCWMSKIHKIIYVNVSVRVKLKWKSSRLTFRDRVAFRALSDLVGIQVKRQTALQESWLEKIQKWGECWPSALSNRAENSSVTSHTTPPQCQWPSKKRPSPP